MRSSRCSMNASAGQNASDRPGVCNAPCTSPFSTRPADSRRVLRQRLVLASIAPASDWIRQMLEQPSWLIAAAADSPDRLLSADPETSRGARLIRPGPLPTRHSGSRPSSASRLEPERRKGGADEDRERRIVVLHAQHHAARPAASIRIAQKIHRQLSLELAHRIESPSQLEGDRRA